MPKSGYVDVVVTSWDTLRFQWQEAGQSIENNYSVINWQLLLIAGASGKIASTSSKTWYVSVDGVLYSGSNTVGIENNQTKTLASGQTVVYHGSDGSKTFGYSFSQHFGISFGGSSIGTIEGGSTGILNTIPRASQPSLSDDDFIMGDTITISTNKLADFTHTLEYAFGNASGVIATGVTESFDWEVPLGLAYQIPSAISGVGRIYCSTYSGSTLVGIKTIDFTAHVPENVKPSIPEVVISEYVPGLAEQFQTYVKDKSRLSISATSTGSHGSSINGYKITVNNVAYISQSAITGLLTESGSVVVEVTDSRGRISSEEIPYTVIDYSVPVASGLTASRVDADGKPNDEGINAKIAYSGEISPVGDKNTKSFILRYKKTADITWTTVDVTPTGYLVDEFQVIADFDENSAYNIEFIVTDYFTVAQKSMILSTAFTLMDFFKGGKGIAFGEVATQEGMSINLDAIFKKPVNFTDTLKKGGVDVSVDGHTHPDYAVESGSNANGHYTKFADGTMVCWGLKTFTTAITSPWGALFYGTQQTVVYPIAFIGDDPVFGVLSSYKGSELFFASTGTVGDKTSGKFAPYLPISSASMEFIVSWFAIGRWKE